MWTGPCFRVCRAASRPSGRAPARPISSGALLGGALVATILAISACSTSNVLNLRPDVDVGTQTAAVSGGGMQDLVPDDPYLSAADQAPDGGEQSDFMQSADGYPVEAAQPVEAAEPVEMAQAAGMAQPLDAAPVEAAPVDAGPAEAGPPKLGLPKLGLPKRSPSKRRLPIPGPSVPSPSMPSLSIPSLSRHRSRSWSQLRSSPPIRASTIR